MFCLLFHTNYNDFKCFLLSFFVFVYFLALFLPSSSFPSSSSSSSVLFRSSAWVSRARRYELSNPRSHQIRKITNFVPSAPSFTTKAHNQYEEVLKLILTHGSKYLINITNAYGPIGLKMTSHYDFAMILLWVYYE